MGDPKIHHVSVSGAGASCGDQTPGRVTINPVFVTCDWCLRVLAVRWELGLRLRDDSEDAMIASAVDGKVPRG